MSHNDTYELARNILQQYRQEHLLHYYAQISSSQQEILLEQILNTDFALITSLYQEQQKLPLNSEHSEMQLTPLETQNLGTLPEQEKRQYVDIGWELLRAGKIASFVVAGGQGSRLGHAGPKGTYNIGLPSQKSLFQLQAERLLNLGRRAGRSIPWYIMTSPTNHAETVDFFTHHHYFGYPVDAIFFFQQDVIPAIDLEGRVLLASPYELCLVPNGNGGCFSALRRSGGLTDLMQRGVEWLFYYNVDNALIKVADPTFIGYTHQQGHAIASKVIEKISPEEKVGIFCRKDGRPAIVEYSEFPASARYQRDHSGALLFNAANIAVHLLNVKFVERISQLQLPFKVAKKEVQTVEGSTKAYKFETFMFDAFPYADDMSVIMVEREEDFAPVKNASGTDSPESARNLVLEQQRRWLVAANVSPEAIQAHFTEISPLVSYAGEDLHATDVSRWKA